MPVSNVARRCTICGRRDQKLHGGRMLLDAVAADIWVQRGRGDHIGWVVCKAGGLLCLGHPKLSIGVKPEEAMTRSNLRWGEFTELLKRLLHKRGNSCKAGRDKTQATAAMKQMGLSENLIAPSLDYFESHGGFCDCEIIYNIAMAGR